MNKDGYPVKVEKLFEHQKKAADEACRIFWGEETENGEDPVHMRGMRENRDEV